MRLTLAVAGLNRWTIIANVVIPVVNIVTAIGFVPMNAPRKTVAHCGCYGRQRKHGVNLFGKYIINPLASLLLSMFKWTPVIIYFVIYAHRNLFLAVIVLYLIYVCSSNTPFRLLSCKHII